MSGIKQQTLARALAMLDALAVQYAVIDFDGQKHGVLEVNIPKVKTRTPSGRPHGALSKFATEVIGNMKIGEVVEISPSLYDLETTRKAITSWACNHWGNGTLTTTFNKSTNKLEALRIA